MRPPAHAVLLSTALVFSLTACGGNDEGATAGATPTPTPTSTPTSTPTTPATPTPTPTPAGPVINVNIEGDSVTPTGDRIKAKVNKPITFVVTADRAGGLHVHSSPEQSPEFERGKTTIRVVVDKPGIVEVEEHESDALVVQLEVR